MRSRKKDSYQRGLTLFELLIVLAIIAMISTLVAPRVIGYLGRAKTDIAQGQLASISASLELFYLDMERYPTEVEGLGVLIRAPETASPWQGPYLKNEDGLTDPWGRPYGYNLGEDGVSFEVITLGRDGEVGGEGENSDVIRN